MAARAYWKGYLKISLVSVPVKAYVAASDYAGKIHLNQLHAECHSRIKYVKTCPVHGEVTNDEIVSGYEFAKDQYVVIDPDEIDTLRTEGDKSVTVETFIRTGTLDPIYQGGKSYYLLPDGPVGQKPYALIHKVMQEQELQGVAQVVLSSREQLVLVRPVGPLLGMTGLHYAAQVKEPGAFEDELAESALSDQELQLSRQLLNALVSEEFDIEKYKDVYSEKMTQLIQAKVAGEQLVAPPPEAQPQVINLMEALKASVQQVKPPGRPAAAEKPARKMAASAKKREVKKEPAPEKRRRRRSG